MNQLELGKESNVAITEFEKYVGQLLIEKIKVFNNGDSSTLGIDQTETFLKSIIYNIQLYLQHSTMNIEEIFELKEDLYELARNALDKYVEKTKSLYHLIEMDRIRLNNAIYTETFENAIPNFFRLYDQDYGAHESVSDMDYPLNFDEMTEEGIVYLNSYLCKFRIENQFCSYFEVEEINEILRLYYRQYKCDADTGYLNIFEYVYKNSLIMIISRNELSSLTLLPEDKDIVMSKLSGLSKDNLCKIVKDASDKIKQQLQISEIELISLLDRFELECVSSLYNAVLNDTLHHFNLYMSYKNKFDFD